MRAMILLLNIVSGVLLVAAWSVSVVSLMGILRSYILGKREPSTSFAIVWLVCVISCLLHSKPIPTWFRLVAIITLSISVIEIATKGINLMRKQIKRRFRRQKDDS